MAETIEGFVEKLRDDGVKAGQEAAAQIKSEAQQKAEQTIEAANAQAQKIIEKAESEAESVYNKSQTELKLAIRDAVLKLQDIIAKSISKVLVEPVEDTLSNTEFLATILQDIIVQYADSDSKGKTQIDINVSDKQSKELTDLVLNKLKESGKSDDVSLNFHTVLEKAGFEYKLSGATVEVTQASIVQSLTELVSPRLRELLSQDIQEK